MKNRNVRFKGLLPHDYRKFVSRSFTIHKDINILQNDVKVMYHPRKSRMYQANALRQKVGSSFVVTIGADDGPEICKLGDIYLLFH